MAKDKPQKDERNGDKGSTTPYEDFQEGLKRVLSVSKEELDERLAKEKREKKEKRAG